MKSIRQVYIFLSLSLFLISFSKSFSQGIYFDIGGGYGFNNLQASNLRLAYVLTPDWTPAQITGSFGKGLNYGGDIGYLFTPNYGFEIGINELNGSSYSFSQTDRSTTISQSNYGNMLKIIPTLKITSSDGFIEPFGKVIPQNGGNKMDIYVKFGLVFGIKTSVNSSQTLNFTNTSGPQTVTTNLIYSGGNSMGYTFRLGIAIKQSDHIFFFIEGALNSQFFIPTQGQRTSYQVSGVDQLSTLPDGAKQTTFAGNETYPFSSYGINIGIQIRMENQPKPKRWKG